MEDGQQAEVASLPQPPPLPPRAFVAYSAQDVLVAASGELLKLTLGPLDGAVVDWAAAISLLLGSLLGYFVMVVLKAAWEALRASALKLEQEDVRMSLRYHHPGRLARGSILQEGTPSQGTPRQNAVLAPSQQPSDMPTYLSAPGQRPSPVFASHKSGKGPPPASLPGGRPGELRLDRRVSPRRAFYVIDVLRRALINATTHLTSPLSSGRSNRSDQSMWLATPNGTSLGARGRNHTAMPRCSVSSFSGISRQSTAQSTSESTSVSESAYPKEAATKRWHELTEYEEAAALSLGYSQAGWDNGAAPQACMKPWDALSQEEAAAASILGYGKDEWDEELQVP